MMQYLFIVFLMYVAILIFAPKLFYPVLISLNTMKKKRYTKKDLMAEMKAKGMKLPHGYEIKKRVKKSK